MLLGQPALQQIIGPQFANHQQHTQQQCARQWPAIQRLGGAGLGGLLRHRFELIKGVLDGCKLLTVMGAEVLAAGQAGDFLKRGLVQINPGVNAEEAFGAAVFRVSADADRVDFDPFFSGPAKRYERP